MAVQPYCHMRKMSPPTYAGWRYFIDLKTNGCLLHPAQGEVQERKERMPCGITGYHRKIY